MRLLTPPFFSTIIGLFAARRLQFPLTQRFVKDQQCPMVLSPGTKPSGKDKDALPMGVYTISGADLPEMPLAAEVETLGLLLVTALISFCSEEIFSVYKNVTGQNGVDLPFLSTKSDISPVDVSFFPAITLVLYVFYVQFKVLRLYSLRSGEIFFTFVMGCVAFFAALLLIQSSNSVEWPVGKVGGGINKAIERVQMYTQYSFDYSWSESTWRTIFSFALCSLAVTASVFMVIPGLVLSRSFVSMQLFTTGPWKKVFFTSLVVLPLLTSLLYIRPLMYDAIVLDYMCHPSDWMCFSHYSFAFLRWLLPLAYTVLCFYKMRDLVTAHLQTALVAAVRIGEQYPPSDKRRRYIAQTKTSAIMQYSCIAVYQLLALPALYLGVSFLLKRRGGLNFQWLETLFLGTSISRSASEVVPTELPELLYFAVFQFLITIVGITFSAAAFAGILWTRSKVPSTLVNKLWENGRKKSE